MGRQYQAPVEKKQESRASIQTCRTGTWATAEGHPSDASCPYVRPCYYNRNPAPPKAVRCYRAGTETRPPYARPVICAAPIAVRKSTHGWRAQSSKRANKQRYKLSSACFQASDIKASRKAVLVKRRCGGGGAEHRTCEAAPKGSDAELGRDPAGTPS